MPTDNYNFPMPEGNDSFKAHRDFKALAQAIDTELKKQTNEISEQISLQKYYVSSKEYGVIGDGIADDSISLQMALNEANNLSKTLFVEGECMISVPIDWKGETLGGRLILKEHGLVNMKSNSFAKGMTVLVHPTCVSEEAILYEEKEARIDNLLLTSTSGVIKDMIGVHFKGNGVTCFNSLFNAHIRFASTGLFIDSTENWITNIETDHIRIDYFDEYAYRVGSIGENTQQNSQHNISNIAIQDTEGNRSTRVGLSMGDSWSNYSNIVTFADNPVGTFIPLHMPGLSDNLVEVIRETRANTLNGMILEGNPLCNGYAYLHNLNSLLLLRNRFVNDGAIQISSADTKPRVKFTLADNPVIRIPQIVIDNLITPGNISYTYSNGIVTIKNNATIPLYFILDVRLPVGVKQRLGEGKFSTVALKTNMANAETVKPVLTCSLRNQAETNLDVDRIGYIGTFNQRQMSYAAFHTNIAVMNAASSSEVYVRIGFSEIPAGATYTIDELQFYNQLVPAVNENNLHWTKRNLFN